MAENKHVPALEAAPQFIADQELPIFGAEVVAERTKMLNTAEAMERLWDEHGLARRLEGKRTPHDGRLAYYLGKVSGQSLRTQDRRWLENHQPELVSERLRKRQESYDRYNQQWRQQLAVARDRLQSLGPKEAQRLNRFLNITFNRPGDHRERPWTAWLGREADDGQLTRFFQWHMATLAEQVTSPEFKSSVDRERSKYQREVGQAIEDGWLLGDPAVIANHSAHVPVYVGDIFDTMVGGTSYYRDSGGIVISQGAGGDRLTRSRRLAATIRRDLSHELTHAVFPGGGPVWHDEAWTEHIDRSLRYGKPEHIRPSGRHDVTGLGAYVPERDLLHAIHTAGAFIVPTYLGTHAYSAPEGGPERRRYHDALDEAWGVSGMLFAVTQHHEKLESSFKADGTETDDASIAAAHQTFVDLTNAPERIFGAGYRRPQQRQLAEMIAS